MKKILHFLVTCPLLLLPVIMLAQNPIPFDNCPGVSVAITKPGFNSNLVAHQIYLIDDTTGAITPTSDPIDLQINAFGLNNEDGFLYAMYQSFNVANPFFARVGKNGKYKTLGTITAPATGPFRVGIINTAAGTMDGEDNFYFTAAVVNLQNVLMPPDIYVGKIKSVSQINPGTNALSVIYKKMNPGTCITLLPTLTQNPFSNIVQDIAFNVGNGFIYTFLPAVGATGGTFVKFNPNLAVPELSCVNAPSSNPLTGEISGLFFNPDTTLLILTTDGKYYKSNVQTGEISLITQTTLPLLNNNLRGDMASCVGKKKLHPFQGCPGLALAITRPGINNTGGPHHIYKINPANGNIQPLGHDINLQINGFGLNRKDGFLYGMHEVSEVFGPRLARVDSSGDYIDIDTIPTPPVNGSRKGLINTAAATMDGNDNYYFTAITIDTLHPAELPKLFLGTIEDVSKLKEGDQIHVMYRRVQLGNCTNDIIQSLSNPANGILQDIAYNPEDGRIYTYIQKDASPAPGRLAWLKPNKYMVVMHCIHSPHTNPPTADLSGMHAGGDGKLFILTTDGKYYKGDPHNGMITLIAQTSLPLLSNNLRGDMASCVPRDEHHGHGDGDDDDDDDGDRTMFAGEESLIKVLPNPVNGGEAIIYIEMTEQSNVEMQILTTEGNLTQSSKKLLTKGENQVRIQTRDLKPGLYAVVFRLPSGKTITTKFIRL